MKAIEGENDDLDEYDGDRQRRPEIVAAPCPSPYRENAADEK